MRERFWIKVIKVAPEACWLWNASLYGKMGYGQARSERGREAAHRIVYRWTYGEIPAGLVVDHLCRVPQCVNPEHLEAVTQSVNTSRAPERIICKAGHPFDAINTRYYGTKKVCRACERIRDVKRGVRRTL